MIQLVRPHRGPVTQRYGNIQPDGLPHAGQDYGYTDGVNIFPEVYAAADGVVLFAGDSRTLGWPNQWYVNPDFDRTDAQDSSAGNLVVIGHAGGVDTGYAHLESFSVKAGDKVRANQKIAITGTTGYSFGKHLHFFLMFRPYNYATNTYGCSDPNPYFAAGGAAIAPQGTTTTPKELFTVGQYEVLNEKLDKIANTAQNTWAGVWKGGTAPDGKVFNYGALPIVAHSQAVAATQAANTQAQIKGLVGAIAALAKGEAFDEAKLLAGVQAAAEAGVKAGIADGTVTVDVNVNGGAL